MNIDIYKDVQEIRFLPNDKNVFPSYEEMIYFLTNTMVKRGGIYNYPGAAMRCKENTLVFFQ